VERSDKTGTAMLSEGHLPEQMPRVQQPPKMRKTFGVTQIQSFIQQKTEFARRAGSLNLEKI